MRLGFLKDNESRVSVTPSSLKKYIDSDHSVSIEKNAGEISGFSDKSYNHDKFLNRKEVINFSDVIVLVSSSSIDSYKDLITFVSDRPGHDQRYAIDSSKITKELGWKAVETFETGIYKTVAWYVKNSKWWERVLSGEYQLGRMGKKN